LFFSVSVFICDEDDSKVRLGNASCACTLFNTSSPLLPSKEEIIRLQQLDVKAKRIIDIISYGKVDSFNLTPQGSRLRTIINYMLFLQKVVYVTKRGLNMKDKFLSGIGL
jgi:hypothetical protein